MSWLFGSTPKKNSFRTEDADGSGAGSAFIPEKKERSPNNATEADDDELAVLDGAPRTIQKKITREIEVPVTYQVKVPVKVQKIVPTTVQMEVQCKSYEEVKEIVEQEENYTEMVEEKCTRVKIVWEKKIVKEKYMKKVPVTKTRKVRKPITRVVEQDVSHVVEVPGTKLEQSTGFRIDEVEDVKKVRLEEIEEFELHPHFKGRIEGPKKFLGKNPEKCYRSQGDKVYFDGDKELEGLREDPSVPSATDVIVTPSDGLEESPPSNKGKVLIESLDLKNEVVTMVNQSDEPINMAGWQLMDEQQHSGQASTNVYTFEEHFILNEWQKISIYSGPDSEQFMLEHVDDTDRNIHLQWPEKAHMCVWNDDGDTAYLKDNLGNLVSVFEGEVMSSPTRKSATSSPKKSPAKSGRKRGRRPKSSTSKKQKKTA